MNMKIIKIYPVLLLAALFGVACNPIEDQSLRDKYIKNAGEPITQAELDAALSVTQPIPNSDDKVEGDQYVVLINKRPDIGGAWHYATSAGTKTTGSDSTTIIYGANGDYDIYYEGISANQVVRSKTFQITVTNCFDVYDELLSGAKDKSDITAKKTWKFLDANGALYNGQYGNWKYYPMSPGLNSWGTVNTADVDEKTMTFEFNGHKMTTYYADGSVAQTGNWAYTHDTPEGVIGELFTTAPVLGTSESWNDWSGVSTPYWILVIDENQLILCFPSIYNKSADVDDWDLDAMYFFFVPAE